MDVFFTEDQLKRLRIELLKLGFAKSNSQARKMTSTPTEYREAAKRLFAWHGVPSSLDDISDLLVVEEKPIVLKPVRKTRGKGVKPAKIMHRLRLDKDLIDRLKLLGGNISAHIRRAIEEYLKKREGEREES
jgi:post-segregation antitoxin (ccd killing protein)